MRNIFEHLQLHEIAHLVVKNRVEMKRVIQDSSVEYFVVIMQFDSKKLGRALTNIWEESEDGLKELTLNEPEISYFKRNLDEYALVLTTDDGAKIFEFEKNPLKPKYDVYKKKVAEKLAKKEAERYAKVSATAQEKAEAKAKKERLKLEKVEKKLAQKAQKKESEQKNKQSDANN